MTEQNDYFDSIQTKIIRPTKLTGKIYPPPSKAISHRSLIFAAFSKPHSSIHNLLGSEDVRATKEALEAMGAEFITENNSIIVKSNPTKAAGEINCLNSGTTLRLLTGLSSKFKGKTTLTGDESLMTRPMGPLVASLGELGAKLTTNKGKPPVVITEAVKEDKRETIIRGDVSSQYISSLIILASLRKDITTTITLLPPVVSKPYIDLTITMLKNIGISIAEEKNKIVVSGVERYGKHDFTVPADLSSAAFYIVAGALPGNSIILENIKEELPQADARVIDVVKEAGALVEQDGTTIKITGEKLEGFEVDLSQSPDIFPILCVLAAAAQGSSKLYNAKHLRVKETDRIKAMLHNLAVVGIDFEELDDGAIIHGGIVNGNVELNSFLDHRIAMACTILGSIANEPVYLKNWDCVDVSYPSFYQDFEKLSK